MRGHGTFANDRPAVHGVVSRESKDAHLRVAATSSAGDLAIPLVEELPLGATMFTDEWPAYNCLAGAGFRHKTVNHSKREWARDDDGDGVREVHTNTIEGLWTGLRNHLRTFRGVSKTYLAQYVAVFEWAHRHKRLAAQALAGLLTTFPEEVCRGTTFRRA